VLAGLNAKPREMRDGTDFSRVKQVFLEDKGKYYRQTVFLSSHADPTLSFLFAQSGALVPAYGRALMEETFGGGGGGDGDKKLGAEALTGVGVPGLKMVFRRVEAPALPLAPDAKFKYFVESVLPYAGAHTCVFIPDYFDYVLVRNYLMKARDKSFVAVHEYSRGTEVSRARARFFHGQRDLMLLTGRALFYHRYKIRGISSLIFYSAPTRADQFAWMANLLEEAAAGSGADASSAAAASCLTLYTKYEALALQRLVGDGRARAMLTSAKHTFMFV